MTIDELISRLKEEKKDLQKEYGKNASVVVGIDVSLRNHELHAALEVVCSRSTRYIGGLW